MCSPVATCHPFSCYIIRTQIIQAIADARYLFYKLMLGPNKGLGRPDPLGQCLFSDGYFVPRPCVMELGIDKQRRVRSR